MPVNDGDALQAGAVISACDVWQGVCSCACCAFVCLFVVVIVFSCSDFWLSCSRGDHHCALPPVVVASC